MPDTDPLALTSHRTADKLCRGMPTVRPRRWSRLMLSLLLTSALLVPAAYWLMPHVLRWHMIRQLTSADLIEREQALHFVIRRANANSYLQKGAIQNLAVEDTTNFLQIVNALDQARLWHRPQIPDASWLRWLTIVAADSSPDSRMSVAQLVAQLSDLADDARVIALVESLSKDEHTQVRYNALLVAAELLGAAQDGRTYRAMIQARADDTEPVIARDAWMLLGLMDAIPNPHSDWLSKSPETAQAILWAMLNTDPDEPLAAIKVLNDSSVDTSVRAMAVYALSASATTDAQDSLAALIPSDPKRVTDENQLLVWRAVLGVRRRDDQAGHSRLPDTVRSLLGGLASNRFNSGDRLGPVVLAALHRYAPYNVSEDAPVVSANVVSPSDRSLLLLSELEGIDADRLLRRPIDALPDMVRLAAIAVMQKPDPGQIRDLFEHPAETIRDLACVISADRFTVEQIEGLVVSLLNDFNDNAKCSGAILAGLTGVKPTLLEEKWRQEDVWAVQTIMRLGRHMQGLPLDRGSVTALLTRDDLPRTTILLALLETDTSRALDALLNPRGEETYPLVELLDEARWWHVLRRYLPCPPDAPPTFWLWADTQLQQFQVDLIRLWYLLNRHRYRQSKK